MKISVVTADELDHRSRLRWRSLQLSNPALASPYFCVEFTCAVAAVRDDVRVAVIEDDSGPIGYFPFQRQFGVGRPIGGPLSDHHGVITDPDTQWDWQKLLKDSGLAYWHFDHLVASQSPAGTNVTTAWSPALDLSQGFDAYKMRRLAAGCRRIAEFDRKARKMSRELGPLRFERHTTDRRVFWQVLKRKTEQCLRTGVPDVFGSTWTRGLVDRISGTNGPHFAGELSALYAGDTMVAAHLGMRSSDVWHWWFPVYDPAHAKYSPGGLLLVNVAQAAASHGLGLLDLGKGDDTYKQSFADCSLPLVEGCVVRPALLSAVWELRQRATHFLRTSAIVQPLRPLIRSVRHRLEQQSGRHASAPG